MTMVEVVEEEGEIKEQEKEFIHNIFEFDDTNASEIMTPRADMFVIDIDEKFSLEEVSQSGFTRFPVIEGDIHHVIGFGDPDALAEIAYGFRGVAPAAQAGYRRHARIVPAVDMAFFHEANELALAEHHVVEVQTRKFDLLGMIDLQLIQHPVIKLAIIFKLQGAVRMGDALDRI